MKLLKTTLIIVFLFQLSQSLAQPTIGLEAMIFENEAAPVQYTQDYFEPGPSGPNVSWDFSGLVDGDFAFDWESLDPANTIFADSFPDATHAFLFPDSLADGTVENWIYYKVENGDLSLLGVANLLTGQQGTDTTFGNYSEDPDLLFSFPIQYQDSMSDPLAGHNIVSFSGNQLVLQRSGNTTTVADAYGSLITPAGSFQNVLRVKRTEEIQDLFMGFPSGSQSVVRYDWLAENEKYVLMHMEVITIQPMGGPASTDTITYYRSGEPTTSIEALEMADKMKMNAYPNPSRGLLQLDFTLEKSQAVQLSLQNFIGQTIWTQSLNPMSPGHQSHSIDLQMIPAGTYLLNIHSGGTIASKKIQLN